MCVFAGLVAFSIGASAFPPLGMVFLIVSTMPALAFPDSAGAIFLCRVDANFCSCKIRVGKIFNIKWMMSLAFVGCNGKRGEKIGVKQRGATAHADSTILAPNFPSRSSMQTTNLRWSMGLSILFSTDSLGI